MKTAEDRVFGAHPHSPPRASDTQRSGVLARRHCRRRRAITRSADTGHSLGFVSGFALASDTALRWCIAVTRRGGVVSVPGNCSGFIQGFLVGDAFDKGLTFRMGQAHAQKLMPALLEHIQIPAPCAKEEKPAQRMLRGLNCGKGLGYGR